MFRFWNPRVGRASGYGTVDDDDDDEDDDDDDDDDEENDGGPFSVDIESIGAGGGARVGETSVSKRRRLGVAETKQEQAFEDKEEG